MTINWSNLQKIDMFDTKLGVIYKWHQTKSPFIILYIDYYLQ